MTDLDKAREWAESVGKNEDLMSEPRAAVEVIRSLPDSWVDAENVQAMIDNYKHARDSNAEGTEGWVINHLMVSNLESLIPTPKLPTLADMTQEERKACQWMQADVKLSGEGSVTCVIADPRIPGAKVRVWAPHGGSDDVEADRVTPLSGEPKLKWPGSEPDDVAYATGGVLTTQDVVDECRAVRKERAVPRPEGVPPNEPWLIEVGGQKAIGTRFVGNTVVPWSVASLDGSFAGDNEITLIRKLVPETPALPEGMRLADHPSYGRVVVAPHANTHGEESFYRTNEDSAWGASHGYRPTEQFTFLDGEA